ncbi:MAG: hypothetical protein QME77_09465 [bacterium]|nr:hypothetical protein [bacterium]
MTVAQTTLFAPPPPTKVPAPQAPLLPLAALGAAPLAALDVETDSIDPRRARLTHVAWATQLGSGALTEPTAGDLRALQQQLRGTRIVFHSGGYDLVVLARHGCDLLSCSIDDTRVISVLLDENGTHTLQSLCRRYLKMTNLFRIPEVLRGQTDSMVVSQLLEAKGRVDCEGTLDLYEALRQKINTFPSVADAYEIVERPLVGLLSRLVLRGLPVDRTRLRAAMLRGVMERVSPRTLARLARWDPEISAAGRYHPLYSAWGSPTGVIMMQGVRADGSPSLLDFLAPPEGRTLLAVTMANLPLRWMATLAACGQLLAALRAGLDPGEALAAQIGAEGPPASVLNVWLQALATGAGPRAVIATTGLRLREVRAAREAVLRALPQVDRWLTSVEEAGARRGWLQAPMGRRRRYAPRYLAKRAGADLAEIASADVMKLMLYRLEEDLPPGAHIVGVHRWTVYVEAPEGQDDDVAAACREAAKTAARGLACPPSIRISPVVSAR